MKTHTAVFHSLYLTKLFTVAKFLNLLLFSFAILEADHFSYIDLCSANPE